MEKQYTQTYIIYVKGTFYKELDGARALAANFKELRTKYNK